MHTLKSLYTEAVNKKLLNLYMHVHDKKKIYTMFGEAGEFAAELESEYGNKENSSQIFDIDDEHDDVEIYEYKISESQFREILEKLENSDIFENTWTHHVINKRTGLSHSYQFEANGLRISLMLLDGGYYFAALPVQLL